MRSLSPDVAVCIFSVCLSDFQMITVCWICMCLFILHREYIKDKLDDKYWMQLAGIEREDVSRWFLLAVFSYITCTVVPALIDMFTLV